MTRPRISPAFVIATAALVVAVSSGTAVAATLITGRQVADRSLTAVDIARNSLTGVEVRNRTLTGADVALNTLTNAEVRNRSLRGSDMTIDTLTGVEINEGTLGTVPSAATATSAGSATTAVSAGTASTLDGLPASAFVRASRVQSAAVSIVDLTGGKNLVLTDSRLGLRVSYLAPAKLLLENTHPTASIAGDGIGMYTTPAATTVSIPAGGSQVISFEAVGVQYVDLLLRQRVAPASASPVAHLTCSMDDASPGNAFSCVLVG